MYTIYEIFAYITIHYHRRLVFGLFEFMEVSGEYYLSNIRKGTLVEGYNFRNEYTRSALMEKVEKDDGETIASGVVSVM